MLVFGLVCFTDASRRVSDLVSPPRFYIKGTLLMYVTLVITAHMGMSHKNISFL